MAIPARRISRTLAALDGAVEDGSPPLGCLILLQNYPALGPREATKGTIDTHLNPTENASAELKKLFREAAARTIEDHSDNKRMRADRLPH